MPRPLPAPVAAATAKRGDTAPNPAVKRDAVPPVGGGAANGGSENLMAPLSEAPALTVEHTQPNPPVRMEKAAPVQPRPDKPQSVSVSPSVKADKKSG